jgi:flagellar biosynthesis protein FliR
LSPEEVDAALLVFARCVGFVFRAPGFSHPGVPPPVRAGLALAMTGALAPTHGVHVTRIALWPASSESAESSSFSPRTSTGCIKRPAARG